MNVVKAKTVDLLVPAEAEIVIEGTIDTEYLEPEGPFGESHGHVNLQEFNGVMEVTAITHRRNPVMVNPGHSACTRTGDPAPRNSRSSPSVKLFIHALVEQ